MSIGDVIVVMWHGEKRRARILKIRDGIPHVQFV